ncbi:5-oxoprolinase subunit PxpA [Flavihumibacter stibioxidans]|uniref:Lactam utilization protein LamB n=1 Tax=Flavihumibacter stibioxidans TaxID=1834163 RepID=A0ABR7MEB1_9BACT|nr:5-oxoprolinase subunit PxpA [Flavihumibacter stibioxidans]MBC6492864.1 lactam utilization protein LamB [Flavihumibacter stibioxidans]
MRSLAIDINCDLGEGTGHEAAILPLISSVNIACGFHAGNAHTMQETARLAKKFGVAVGAHPSWEDREHFGRRTMQVPPGECYALILYQIGALYAICKAEDIQLTHVKPHGALYNQAATDPDLAKAIAAAVKDFDPALVLYGMAGSLLVEAGKRIGLPTASEGFADRTYTRDGLLTPRTMHNAMITETKQAVQQAIRMIEEQTVTSADGLTIPLPVDTICIHGDGAHAPEFARALSEALTENNIRVRPPHGPARNNPMNTSHP